jgi:hypothetical protein
LDLEEEKRMEEKVGDDDGEETMTKAELLAQRFGM